MLRSKLVSTLYGCKHMDPGTDPLLAAQGVPTCSLIVSGAGSSSVTGVSNGGGGLVVVDSTGAALFSTERVLLVLTGYSGAEVYNVAAGTWSPATQLPDGPQNGFAQTRLLTGEVLQVAFHLAVQTCCPNPDPQKRIP